MLTADQLRERASFDPQTGIFTWIVATNNRVKVGDVAGTINQLGYRRLIINKRSYSCARLAWLYMTGEWPRDQIDHINLSKADNRWCNLREATPSQNQANSGVPRNNSSGFKGVFWEKSRGKWRAEIKVNKKGVVLGRFATREAAHAAYCTAAKNFFGEFMRVA